MLEVTIYKLKCHHCHESTPHICDYTSLEFNEHVITLRYVCVICQHTQTRELCTLDEAKTYT